MSVKVVSLVHAVRRLRGSSQPILAMADDGAFYVVKMRSGHTAVNALFNEAAGSVLYQSFGLRVPDWKPVFASTSFLEQNPIAGQESQVTRSEPRFVFGSRLAVSLGGRMADAVPSTSFSRLNQREHFWLAWLIDACAYHSDARQAVFMRSEDGRIDFAFIDHERMFGGIAGLDRPKVIASRYLDARIYPELTDSILDMIDEKLGHFRAEECEAQVRTFPEAWITPGALQSFSAALFRLTDRKMWENVLDRMIEDAPRHRPPHETDAASPRIRPNPRVLHS